MGLQDCNSMTFGGFEMAFDGNGNYNPPAPEYPLQPQTVISSADMNTIIQDIASALGNCMTLDSQGALSVDLNLFTKKIINLGAATNPNDAMRKVDVETYAITATTDRDMAGFRLKNLPAVPVAGTDAVSADYVNTAQTDRSMGGFRLDGAAAAPYAADELVPKQYVDDQDALKANLAGATYTGTHDLIGATTTVATQTPADSSTKAASTAFVQSVAMNAALPGLVGNALKFLRTNAGETSAEWAEVIVYGGRSARTSNSILAAGDLGKLIDITSGTFTQTFTAAATLGPNWFCYLRNSGTGDIMLDPNGSELIDGLASYVMYPGETRLVTCNGTGFYTIVLTGYYLTFTSGGAWTKPPGYAAHSGLLWGGGGGGGRATGNNVYTGGGGGGACCPFSFDSNSLAATVTVTIGSGGAASITANVAAGTGGQSQFHTARAYGGGGAYPASGSTGEGGSGGGLLSTGLQGQPGGSLIYGGAPVHAQTAGGISAGVLHNTGFGGGSTVSGIGGDSAYGGGGGAVDATAGKSVYGGGGGSGAQSTPGGTSVFGGAGGTGFYGGSGNATSPGIPAGGGGSVSGDGTGAPSAGARGELRIWGVL